MPADDAITTLIDPDSADLSLIQDRAVAVLGFGAEAEAHVLNLRDSGVDVRVGADPDSHAAARAEAEGVDVRDVEAAVAAADIIVLTGEESAIGDVYAVLDGSDPEDLVVVTAAHLVPEDPPAGVDLGLVRALAPGPRMRQEYLDGRGVPVLVGIEQDSSGFALPVLTAYLASMGSLRSGAFRTSAADLDRAEEAADLVLHDVVLRLVATAYDALAESGVDPVTAYVATLHRLRDRVDQLDQGGLSALLGPVGLGGTADAGILDDAARARIRQVVTDPGAARAWAGSGDGVPTSRRAARRAEHPLDRVGRAVRARMPWVRG